MTYDEYLKEKIINIYFKNQKIGKHSVDINDFNFIEKIFNNCTQPIKANIFEIDQLLGSIISTYEKDLTLQNKIGLDFLDGLKQSKLRANIFLKETNLKAPQISMANKIELEKNYTQLSNKYGLKEFYYTLDPTLSCDENYNKAILLLNKTKVELEKIQNSLQIKDSSKIGNNILCIQVNWQEEHQNNGYYNYCSNTICLKDENTTFPLVHEYVHFIDKTTTCLLLTGKTSQQLYEEKLHSQKELFENFDMSIFNKIEFKKENFPWIEIIKLKSLFNEEIKQNKYIEQIFNNYSKTKNYKKEFKDIMFEWIENKNFINKIQLKKEIDEILNSKQTNFNFENKNYSNDEKEIIGKTLTFNTFDLSMNNSKNWSEQFDWIIKKSYYTTPKEMLARTIEKSVNNKLEQLSDILTTPVLSNKEENELFNIIKSWQIITEDCLSYQNSNNVKNKIKNVRENLLKNPNLISHLKLK